MKQRPVIIFADVTLEDVITRHLGELLAQTEVLAPGLRTLDCPEGVTKEIIAERKNEAMALITRIQPVTASDLDAMPHLKLISAWGVGYNQVDVAAATARGIPVRINPVFSRAVAEAALTLILALAKRLPDRIRSAHEGRVPGHRERGTEIRGRTLGVIGFGRIGRELGDLGRRLEMQVLAFDPYLPVGASPDWCQLVSLDELLTRSDYVVALAPLTPTTHHLIGAAQLALMRPTAYLLNLGRGALVDEAALLAALEAGRIAGAGLDVWEREPVRPDHPLLARADVIGTPHALAATWESLEAVCRAIQTNVLRVLAGERPHDVINPQIYEEETV
jgi:phosphoglycerate dehydrogenase-like enzyme